MRVDFGVVVVIVSRGVEVGKGLFSEDHTIKFTCDKYYLSHSLPPCLFCPSQYTQGSTLDKAMQAMFHCHNHIRKLASVFFFLLFFFFFFASTVFALQVVEPYTKSSSHFRDVRLRFRFRLS